MRGFYDLPERQLEAVFQDAGRPVHERLAAIAAYLYRHPDDTGLRLFYPALEGIEEVAFGISCQKAAADSMQGYARRAAAKPKRHRVVHAA